MRISVPGAEPVEQALELDEPRRAFALGLTDMASGWVLVTGADGEEDSPTSTMAEIRWLPHLRRRPDHAVCIDGDGGSWTEKRSGASNPEVMRPLPLAGTT